MRESCKYGTVRGARGNSRPYRDSGAPSHGPDGGVADSLDEAKAAFRKAWEAHGVSPLFTNPG